MRFIQYLLLLAFPFSAGAQSTLSLNVGPKWRFSGTDLVLTHVSKGDTVKQLTWENITGQYALQRNVAEGDTIYLDVVQRTGKRVVAGTWYTFHEHASGHDSRIEVETKEEIDEILLLNLFDSFAFNYWSWTTSFLD